MTPFFYKSYKKYDFMLIYQLDVFVFKNELLAWCEKGYDYIGAPWVDEDWPQKTYNLYLESKNPIKKFIVRKIDFNKGKKLCVGNGGFSLRKVRTFLRISRILKLFKGDFSYIEGLHEDVFWSIYVTKYFKHFNVPSFEEALKFSFENKPSKLYAINNNELPFGCHAWELHDKSFWEQYIK
jgi:hypothetical protein